MQKTREEAEELLKTYVKADKMLAHCYSSEAVMRALAIRLNADAEKWAIAGLLHDLDVEITNADPKTHALETERILKENNYDEELIEAIKLHNEDAHNIPRTKLFHHALAAGETITGLIFATALVYPEKKLEPVKVKSITKRMKEKAFAASVNRETIMECEKLGLSIDEFSEIALTAMKKISDKVGL
jgi:putative nucleotidyltransferase with HDIG domain